MIGSQTPSLDLERALQKMGVFGTVYVFYTSLKDVPIHSCPFLVISSTVLANFST